MSKQLPFGLGDAGLTDYRSDQEREFLEALCLRAEAAGWYADAWPRPDRVILSVVVNDSATGQLSRTLRIDFDGKNIAVGYDPTHQLVDEWDLSDPDSDNERRSISDLATDAADWIEEQLALDHSESDSHVHELPNTTTHRSPFGKPQ